MTDILYLPFIQCIDCFCSHVLYYYWYFFIISGFFGSFTLVHFAKIFFVLSIRLVRLTEWTRSIFLSYTDNVG